MERSKIKKKKKKAKEKDIEKKKRKEESKSEVKLINGHGSREISRESSIRGKTDERPSPLKFYSR